MLLEYFNNEEKMGILVDYITKMPYLDDGHTTDLRLSCHHSASSGNFAHKFPFIISQIFDLEISKMLGMFFVKYYPNHNYPLLDRLFSFLEPNPIP